MLKHHIGKQTAYCVMSSRFIPGFCLNEFGSMARDAGGRKEKINLFLQRFNALATRTISVLMSLCSCLCAHVIETLLLVYDANNNV